MLASAGRNSWKKLHFSALPSDINLCVTYFLFHPHLGRLCHGERQLLLSQRDTAMSHDMVATSRYQSEHWCTGLGQQIPARAAGKVSICWDPGLPASSLA